MPVSQGGKQREASRGRDSGGDNHGRAGRAIAALVAVLLALAPAASAQEGNPLVQTNVPAEATAENAVVARDRALASGQRIAYQRMAAQLGLPTDVSDRTIESAVSSLIIESERITPRGYSARITVNFRGPRGGQENPQAGAPAASEPLAAGGGPAVATMEALAQYRSLGEYAEITRRLGSAPAVARTEILGIAGDRARLRLSLRLLPPLAAEQLAGAGLTVEPGAAGGTSSEGWRLTLAGGR